jgi:hypothetical protein
MTRDELNDALLRFGGKLERWPQPERDAARLLVKGDAVAAKMLSDFVAFEQTIAEAVRSEPFGATEISTVLARLDTAEAGWRPSTRFWIASAGFSALSFAAGFAAILMVSSQDVAPSLMDLASGQVNLGGLL